jgi:hypothetical protein
MEGNVIFMRLLNIKSAVYGGIKGIDVPAEFTDNFLKFSLFLPEGY